MKSLSFPVIAAFLLISCMTNAEPPENDPDEPGSTILNPEWEILQRSPVANGNAEAWGLDIQDNRIYWAVSQNMEGKQMDISLQQLNIDGSRNWTAPLVSNPYTDQAYFLNVNGPDAYIGGRTCNTPVGIAGCDALIVKADAGNGSVKFEISYDRGFGYEEVDGVVTIPDGLLVSGWSMGDGTAMDILLQKYNLQGDLQWTQTWTSPGNRDDHQDGHIVVDDSHIYMPGLYDGSPGLGWNGKSLLMKVDRETGALVDSVTFGRTDPWVNAENALGMTSDGTSLYLTGYTTPSSNNWDIFVAKYDKNLNRQWYTTWGGDDTESARSLVLDSSGNIYVAGTTKSFGNGGFEVVLLKLGPSGSVQWYRHWGEEGDDNAFDIRLHNQTVYITGRTNSFHPNAKNEAFLISERIN